MLTRRALPLVLILAAVVLGTLTAPRERDAQACGFSRDQFADHRSAVYAFGQQGGRAMYPTAWCADGTADASCITAQWRGNAGESWATDLQLVRWNMSEWKVTGASTARRK